MAEFPGYNEENAVRQIEYLKKITRWPTPKLLENHKERFPPNSPYFIENTERIPRFFLERRLFYYYMLKRPHLTDLTGTRQIKRKAKSILSKTHTGITEYVDNLVADEARQLSKFTKEGINQLTLEQVDKYLQMIGYDHPALPYDRRQILLVLSEIIPNMDDGAEVTRFSRITRNKYILRDLLVEHPHMDYALFVAKFGKDMPMTSRASFNNARSWAIRMGYISEHRGRRPKNRSIQLGEKE